MEMAQLYDVDVRTINYHLKKVFDDSELQEEAVIHKIRITASDGNTYVVQDRLFESDLDRVVAETKRLAERTDAPKPRKKKKGKKP